MNEKDFETISQLRLGELVDQLGELKSMISDLTRQEALIKETLIIAGMSPLEGQIFRATINTHTRINMDLSLVRTFLTRDQLDLCEIEVPVTQVRVVSKIRHN